MNITWKTYTPRMGTPVSHCYVNKFHVGSVGYAMRSKTDPVAYFYQSYMPGISKAIANGEMPSMKEAMERVEEITKFWFEQAQK